MNFELLSIVMRAEQAAVEAADGGEGGMGSILMYYLVMFGVVIAMMYFIAIRPQKKKEKEAKEMRDSLQIGDEVTTIGGITGIIVRKNEDTVVIETGGDRSKIRVKIWAISENATVHDTSEEAAVKKK